MVNWRPFSRSSVVKQPEGTTGRCVMEEEGGRLIFSVVLRQVLEVEGLLLQDLFQEDPGATTCGCHDIAVKNKNI